MTSSATGTPSIETYTGVLPPSVTISWTSAASDTDLALTGVPGTLTVPASSKSGGIVTYTQPTATDEETPPSVSCNHPSGSTFPIGTTTVTCSATDSDDTPSTVSASFNVTVTQGPFAPTMCTGSIGPTPTTVPGDLVVPPGATYYLYNVTVLGNVQVQSGGTLYTDFESCDIYYTILSKNVNISAGGLLTPTAAPSSTATSAQVVGSSR